MFRKGVYVDCRRGVLTRDALHEAVKDELEWPVGARIQEKTVEAREATETVIFDTSLRYSQATEVDRGSQGMKSHPNENTHIRYAVTRVIKASIWVPQKYTSGHDDNFDTNYTLFNEHHDQPVIPQGQRHISFLCYAHWYCTKILLTTCKMTFQFGAWDS